MLWSSGAYRVGSPDTLPVIARSAATRQSRSQCPGPRLLSCPLSSNDTSVLHSKRRVLDLPAAMIVQGRGRRRLRDVGDPSLMRVFNRKSVFRLGLSRVFARASVVGLTGHSAISQEFPCRGLAPTLARCLSVSGGWSGGRLHLRRPAGADRQTNRRERRQFARHRGDGNDMSCRHGAVPDSARSARDCAFQAMSRTAGGAASSRASLSRPTRGGWR